MSSFGGHETEEAALADAKECMQSDDIDLVWVRNERGEVVWRSDTGRVYKRRTM